MNIIRPSSPNHRIVGFTLLELMVAIIIVSVLAALAGPSFSNLIANQRAKRVASDMFGSLLIARSEAITRNANVTMSQKSGDWANGWQVTASDGTILDDKNQATSVTITPSPSTSSIAYNASGHLTATAPTFVITTTAGSETIYQCVSVSLSGRPYMKAASSC
jgi:prepilin-type N-terminal cleavage/methylation domain